MIKKQLAFIQEWIGHDDIHPLLSHIITYLDPKSVAQFLRCNKQLYYKPVLPLIWTQFITTDTYTPLHLVLWKTLAIDRFHRDTPGEEDKERLHSLLTEEKLALKLQRGYPNLDTDYNTSLRLYRDLQEQTRTLTLDNNQQTKLVTLYRLHKQHFSCSDKDILPKKAVSLMQASTIDLDDLNTHIQDYINTKLPKEKETLFERLREEPGSNEAKAAHTQDITTRLTDHPLLVFATDEEGATPLHLAAWKGHTEVVKYLLANWAEVNAKDEDGWTPLHLAARMGYTEIAKCLIARGADVKAKDKDGTTPLQLAPNDAIKALLQEAGART